MMNSKSKILDFIYISGLTVTLGLFSGEIGAAFIDGILYSNGTTTVTDSRTADPNNPEHQRLFIPNNPVSTVLLVNFLTDTTNVWVDLNQFSSNPFETLIIKLNNFTSQPVNKLKIDIVKLNGETIGDPYPAIIANQILGNFEGQNPPSANSTDPGSHPNGDLSRWHYEFAIIPAAPLLFAGANTTNDNNFGVPVNLFSFGLWPGLAINGSDWWVNIDFNDDPSDKTFEMVQAQVQSVPIPGAIWLFGSGLLGLLLVRVPQQAKKMEIACLSRVNYLKL